MDIIQVTCCAVAAVWIVRYVNQKSSNQDSSSPSSSGKRINSPSSTSEAISRSRKKVAMSAAEISKKVPLIQESLKGRLGSYHSLNEEEGRAIVEQLILNEVTTVYVWIPKHMLTFISGILSGGKDFGHCAIDLAPYYSIINDSQITIRKTSPYGSDGTEKQGFNNTTGKRYVSFSSKRKHTSYEEELKDRTQINHDSINLPGLNTFEMYECLNFMIDIRTEDFSSEEPPILTFLRGNPVSHTYMLLGGGKYNKESYRLAERNCSTVVWELIKAGLCLGNWNGHSYGLIGEGWEENREEIRRLWLRGREEFIENAEKHIHKIFISTVREKRWNRQKLIDITMNDTKDIRSPLYVYIVAKITEFCLTQSSVSHQLKAKIQNGMKLRNYYF